LLPCPSLGSSEEGCGEKKKKAMSVRLVKHGLGIATLIRSQKRRGKGGEGARNLSIRFGTEGARRLVFPVMWGEKRKKKKVKERL